MLLCVLNGQLYSYFSYSFSTENTRIINLLRQYRDRLRIKGNEEHDEDLDYLLMILDSPFMKDFLLANMSVEDTARFNKMTFEVISALEDQDKDVHLSPEAQRKKQLKRRASIRALKNVVTPQSSPVITPKSSKTKLVHSNSSSVDSPLLQSVMATLSSRESSREATPSETYSSTPPPSPKLLPPPSNHGINRIYINPYTGKFELPIDTDERGDSPSTDDGLSVDDDEDLSTVAERTSTSLSNETNFLPNETTFSRKSSISSNVFNGPRVGAMSATPTQQNERGGQPFLPSYNEVLNARRKARSFEKIPGPPTHTNEEKFLSNVPPQPNKRLHPQYNPLGGPMTSGMPTSNLPTNQMRDGNIITVRLQKGDKGLGLSIGKPRPPHKTFVQDIQPGGVAHKDGRIRKGDQILSINGQNVTGVSQPTVVALLQQAQGVVELALLRSNGEKGSGVPEITPTMTVPIPSAVPLLENVRGSSPRKELLENVRTSSPRKELLENVRTSSPRKELLENVRSSSPRKELLENVRTSSPRKELLENVRTSSPRKELLENVRSSSPRKETRSPPIIATPIKVSPHYC